MDRRDFLKATAAGVGGLALAGPLQAFAARSASAGPVVGRTYGPITPKPSLSDGVTYLALPDGFEYWAFGAVGSTMIDGQPTPPAHDGMACFRGRGGTLRLVRNHEVRAAGPAIVPADKAWDPNWGGGCTILEFDPRHPPLSAAEVPSWAAIGGTSTNCAGGPTPADTWLTCEETTAANGTVQHGYVFEVPASTPPGEPVVAEPIVGMGVFSHEATATDPRTGIVYLTEDSGTAGLFRYVPVNPRRLLDGGQLEMLKVGDAPYVASLGQTVGTPLATSWVPVGNPSTAPYAQGLALGGATFRRLEGAWWGREGVLYFNSTDGGEAAAGQVWAYSPRQGALTLIYESPDTGTLLKPDNLTVDRRGDVWLFEDPDRARQSFIKGLNNDGSLFTFAANVREGTIPGSTTPASWDEFAGGTFSPDGRWLFVNIQTPGVTFAITGPFNRRR